MRRRQVLAYAPALLTLPTLVSSCASVGAEDYDQRVRHTWRIGPLKGLSVPARMRELVRYATLAPSSHNTQCWSFALESDAISILPDWSRRCPAVDPDDHHLFVSLGCAAENLVQAARALGFDSDVTFAAYRDAVRVSLMPAAPKSSALFEAIPQRQSTRGEYDGKPLAVDELQALERAVADAGVQLAVLTKPQAIEAVLELVIEGNTTQMDDPAFVSELTKWIRFNQTEALTRGDGLYAASSGNPTLPSWVARPVFRLAFRTGSENDKYARQMRSSAGVAVFIAASEDKAGWIAVGRAFERFALQATAMGVRTAHLNQPVEVASLRAPMATLAGVPGQRPDLVIRFGRGPTMTPSLRRPVRAVLVDERIAV